MSGTTLVTILAIVLALHGIGHALPLLPLVGITLSQTHAIDSWLLNRFLNSTATSIIAIIIFTMALLGFIGAGLGLLGWGVPPTQWGLFTAGASMVSLLGLGLFWNGFPFFFPNKVGVIVVDVAVLLLAPWL